MTTSAPNPPGAPEPDKRSVLKRLGVVAFLFFVIKGMLWLTVPGVLLVKGCTSFAETVDTREP